MATFTQQRDEMKTCPYNPLHKVSARRLQQHIVKCSKNPANPILHDCPFNALHKIPPNQLHEHILLCKDSRQVIREIDESRNRTVPLNNAVIHRTENPVSSEDWDEEIDKEKAKSYVIPGLIPTTDETDSNEETKSEYCFKTNIEIQCMKPAERKKYYKKMVEKAKEAQESEKVNQTMNPRILSTSQSPSESDDKSQSSSSGVSSDIKSEPTDPGLRKPNTKPFMRFRGIGRGNTPPVPANRQRQIGLNIGNESSIESHIKRELEEEHSSRVKRFSPDLR